MKKEYYAYTSGEDLKGELKVFFKVRLIRIDKVVEDLKGELKERARA